MPDQNQRFDKSTIQALALGVVAFVTFFLFVAFVGFDNTVNKEAERQERLEIAKLLSERCN